MKARERRHVGHEANRRRDGVRAEGLYWLIKHGKIDDVGYVDISMVTTNALLVVF